MDKNFNSIVKELGVEKLQLLAQKAEASNKKLFSDLKRKKPKNLDDVVHKLHDDVFDEIDCLECANCCKSISPTLYDKDIERLAEHFKMKPSTFVEKYMQIDEDSDYVFRQTPCPFLMDDNYCMVYEQRPKACREYPHTDRKRFYQILDLTLKNTFVCPAVYRITELLRTEIK